MKTAPKTAARPRPKIAGYVRVSTTGQSDNGVSLDDQRARLRAHATAHDYELVEIVSETASGALAPSRRPGLARLLADVRAHRIDGLAVLALDRLTRDARLAIDLVSEADAKKWKLLSINESLDTSTAAGRAVAGILAVVGQMIREQIGERTRGALATIAREGRARSRFVPYGYRTADGKTELPPRRPDGPADRRPLVKHEGEQAVLKRIASLRKKGLGARRIAHALNKAKMLTRAGEPWTYRRCRRVLETVDRRAEIAA
jgi:site-specific DNA recombinase